MSTIIQLNLLKMKELLIHKGLLLSKFSIEDKKLISAGNYRDVLKVIIGELAIYGVHLDDRSELTRQLMAEDIIQDAQKTNMPSIIMGDFNATYPEGLKPVMFKSLSKIVPNIIFYHFQQYIVVKIW